jgi:thiol-disulfide isomerase/thioredoxin
LTTDEKTPQTSSGTSFLILLLCAVALSFAFVSWFSHSNNTLSSEIGGLSVGEPAPELVADVWVKGNAPDPAALDGEVYVVVAWATWCYPCYLEAPHLVKVHEQFKEKGVRFFGLTKAYPEDKEPIVSWLNDADITWPNGFGLKAVATLDKYQANAIPAIWVIGRDGKVWWNRGMSDSESLEEALRRTLKKSRSLEET